MEPFFGVQTGFSPDRLWCKPHFRGTDWFNHIKARHPWCIDTAFRSCVSSCCSSYVLLLFKIHEFSGEWVGKLSRLIRSKLLLLIFAPPIFLNSTFPFSFLSGAGIILMYHPIKVDLRHEYRKQEAWTHFCGVLGVVLQFIFIIKATSTQAYCYCNITISSISSDQNCY